MAERCLYCGRPLRSRRSIEIGAGPTCAKIAGWDEVNNANGRSSASSTALKLRRRLLRLSSASVLPGQLAFDFYRDADI